MSTEIEVKDEWCFTFGLKRGVLANYYVLVREDDFQKAKDKMIESFGFEWESQISKVEIDSINNRYPLSRSRCYAIIEEDGRIWYP